MGRMRRASLVVVAALSTAALTTTVVVAPASASDKSSAGRHKKASTVTSAKVCSLLTPAQGAALLGESGQTATPVAQSAMTPARDSATSTMV